MRQAPRPRSRRAAALAQAGGSGEMRHATLTIRVDFGAFGALGPGKVRLMELISQHGSIASAGKAMGMSYRRAWELVGELNAIFGRPLVAPKVGGLNGGGTVLTPFGKSVVKRYRSIERTARKAASAEVRALAAAISRR